MAGGRSEVAFRRNAGNVLSSVLLCHLVLLPYPHIRLFSFSSVFGKCSGASAAVKFLSGCRITCVPEAGLNKTLSCLRKYI
jgi:hypothetical protein